MGLVHAMRSNGPLPQVWLWEMAGRIGLYQDHIKHTSRSMVIKSRRVIVFHALLIASWFVLFHSRIFVTQISKLSTTDTQSFQLIIGHRALALASADVTRWYEKMVLGICRRVRGMHHTLYLSCWVLITFTDTQIWISSSSLPSSVPLCWRSRFHTTSAVNGHATSQSVFLNSHPSCRSARITCTVPNLFFQNFTSTITVSNVSSTIHSTSSGGRLPVTWKILSAGGPT